VKNRCRPREEAPRPLEVGLPAPAVWYCPLIQGTTEARDYELRSMICQRASFYSLKERVDLIFRRNRASSNSYKPENKGQPPPPPTTGMRTAALLVLSENVRVLRDVLVVEISRRCGFQLEGKTCAASSALRTLVGSGATCDGEVASLQNAGTRSCGTMISVIFQPMPIRPTEPRPTPVWPPWRHGSYNHAETYTRNPVRSKNQTTPK
jgi:hypothetical protein